jgi:phage-related minor tail protein
VALNIGSLVGYLDLDAGAFESTLGGALDKLREMGPKGAKIAAGAGAAIGLAIAGAVAGGMDIEKANDKLAAQLGATGPEAGRLGKIAGDLYSGAWGDSMDQVNDAIGAVVGNIKGMRTASDADLQAATRNALDFATAMNVDVSDAAVSAGALVNSGLAKNAGEAFDLLTAAAQKAGPTMVQPVMDAVNEYSKHFAMLGFNGTEAMSVISTAASGGEIAIDKAADAVKEFGIRATDLNDTGAQQSFKDLGLSGKTMADDLLAGGDRAQGATEKIAQALLKVKDPAKQAAIAGGLFGTQIEDIGKDNLPGFLSAMAGTGPQLDKVAGAADRMGQTLNDNASTNIESFKRQAQQAFVNILGGRVLPYVNQAASVLATQFGPALRAIGDWIMNPVLPSLQQLGQFIADNQTPIMIIAGLIAAVFIPHLIALGVQSIIAGGKAVAGWVMQQGAAIAGAAAHSLSVVRVIGGWVLMGVQSLIQAARMAAAWFIALGPIGWAIAAIIAIAAIVIANWDKISGWTKKAWTAVSKWVTEKAGAAINWLKAHWPLILAILAGPIGLAVLMIVRNWDKITAGAQKMKDAVARKFGELVSWVKGVPGKIAAGLGNLGGLLVQKGRDLISGLISGAGSMLSSLGSFFLDKVPGWIREPFKKAMGISSPSKVMAAEGKWLPLGIVEGIKAGAPQLEAAMADLVKPPAKGSMRALAGAPAGMGGFPEAGTYAGGVPQVNVYPQPGQSEYEIGVHAGNSLARRMRNP